MKTLFLALRSVIYMSGFLLFFGWIALLVRTFDRSFRVSLPAATEIPGAILGVVGAILVLACAGVFISRGRGTPAILMLREPSSPSAPTSTFATQCISGA